MVPSNLPCVVDRGSYPYQSRAYLRSVGQNPMVYRMWFGGGLGFFSHFDTRMRASRSAKRGRACMYWKSVTQHTYASGTWPSSGSGALLIGRSGLCMYLPFLSDSVYSGVQFPFLLLVICHFQQLCVDLLPWPDPDFVRLQERLEVVLVATGKLRSPNRVTHQDAFLGRP